MKGRQGVLSAAFGEDRCERMDYQNPLELVMSREKDAKRKHQR